MRERRRPHMLTLRCIQKLLNFLHCQFVASLVAILTIARVPTIVPYGVMSSQQTSSNLLMTLITAMLISSGCTKDVLVCSGGSVRPPVDVLFVIDGSSSMCAYNKLIASSLQQLVNEMAAKGFDARYAVVAFGGLASILVPFTSVESDVKGALSSVGCSRSGWEAGLEALRMSLNANQGSDMQKSCSGNYTSNCTLTWRPDAQRQILMATDEDSDIPYLNSYLMPQQGGGLCPSGYNNGKGCSGMQIEPPFQSRIYWNNNYYRNSPDPLILEDPYYTEIAVTANVIIQNAVSISLIMKSDYNANLKGPQSTFDSYNLYFQNITVDKNATNHRHTAIVQFGDPTLQSQNESLGDFNATETLAALKNASLESSLQGQVLQEGGIMRVYELQLMIDAVNGPTYLSNIFNELVNMLQSCQVMYMLDTTSTSTTTSTTSTTSTSTSTTSSSSTSTSSTRTSTTSSTSTSRTSTSTSTSSSTTTTSSTSSSSTTSSTTTSSTSTSSRTSSTSSTTSTSSTSSTTSTSSTSS
ncbi:hypothetical protein BC830DRAFT_1224162, partial [Chytriomyces sp. MP71]